MDDNDILASALQYTRPARRVQLFRMLRAAAIFLTGSGRIIILLLNHRGTHFLKVQVTGWALRLYHFWTFLAPLCSQALSICLTCPMVVFILIVACGSRLSSTTDIRVEKSTWAWPCAAICTLLIIIVVQLLRGFSTGQRCNANDSHCIVLISHLVVTETM